MSKRKTDRQEWIKNKKYPIFGSRIHEYILVPSRLRIHAPRLTVIGLILCPIDEYCLCLLHFIHQQFLVTGIWLDACMIIRLAVETWRYSASQDAYVLLGSYLRIFSLCFFPSLSCCVSFSLLSLQSV